MATPEGRVKTAIRKFLTERGVYWASIQNGAGAKPGDPDLVLCIRGRFVAIEVKSATGQQSAIQKVREAEITMNKGDYYVVRTLEEMTRILNDLQDRYR